MIPKVVHHIAPGDRSRWHPVWEVCLPSWYEHFPEPEYEHIVWDDIYIDTFIKKKFPQYYDRYMAFPYHIMKIDFFRLALLYTHGGIYVDMDFLCCKNFYSAFKQPVAVVGSPSIREFFQNSLMAAEPGQYIFKQLMEISLELVRTNKFPPEDTDTYVISTTGPRVFSYLDQDTRDTIQKLDTRTFNPPIGRFGKGNYNCIHLLTGTWGQEIINGRMQQAEREGLDYKKYTEKTYQSWRKIDLKGIK